MPVEEFTALIVEETAPARFCRRIGRRLLTDLPDGGLLVRVRYSSLNYKDALSASGNKGVTRNFPHTPGIDAAGEVVSCNDGGFVPGDRVVLTGFDLGMNTPGGFGEYVRVPSHWAVPLPAGLTLRESMILGTAGFTAALSVWKLIRAGLLPTDGDVLVTGATGGVGSIAVAILARAGYRVVAVTGKGGEGDFLRALGASEVLDRNELLNGAERPLLKERWAGAVDAVGGEMLAGVLKGIRYGGIVTCCGLVGSADLHTTVFPFILRGISLLGIDSVQCPKDVRCQVWGQLAGPWKPYDLELIAGECSLSELEEKIEAILRGELRGRTVVRIAE